MRTLDSTISLHVQPLDPEQPKYFAGTGDVFTGQLQGVRPTLSESYRML